MEPGHGQLIGDRRGQYLNRRVRAAAAGRRAAQQAGQVGVGLYREYLPGLAGEHGRGEAEQAQVGADVPHRVPGTHHLGREPEQQRVHAGHRAGEVPQAALRGHVDPCAFERAGKPPAHDDAMRGSLYCQPQVHSASTQ